MKCEPKTKAEESATICFHHNKLLLSKYHPLKKNKLVIHSKTIRKLLKRIRQISVDTAKLFNECINTDSSLITPGQKLCTSCRSKIMNSIRMNKISEENIHEEESPVRNASDEDFEEMQAEDKFLYHYVRVLSSEIK
jgi:hypothetical protein